MVPSIFRNHIKIHATNFRTSLVQTRFNGLQKRQIHKYNCAFAFVVVRPKCLLVCLRILCWAFAYNLFIYFPKASTQPPSAAVGHLFITFPVVLRVFAFIFAAFFSLCYYCYFGFYRYIYIYVMYIFFRFLLHYDFFL